MLGGERGGLKGRERFVSILYVATTLCPYDMSPHGFFSCSQPVCNRFLNQQQGCKPLGMLGTPSSSRPLVLGCFLFAEMEIPWLVREMTHSR